MNVSPEDVSNTGSERRGGRPGNLDVLGRPAGYVVPKEERQPIITDWLPPEENGGRVDWVNAPRSYDEWYRQYRPEAVMWVRRSGVHWSQVDEVVDELMTRFMELDSLGVFRREWKTRSQTGKSNFRSYFSNYVVSRSSGKHRNNVRYLKHNSFIFDAQVGEDGSTWGDVRAPHVEDAAPGWAEFVNAIEVVRRTVNNDELVDAVLLLAQDGDVRQSGLREVLGVTPKAAKSGLDKVRAALRSAMAESA